MGKSITNLAEKAGVEDIVGIDTFAQLIVEECIDVCLHSMILFDIKDLMSATKKEISSMTTLALVEEIKKRFEIC
jgi:hypothetical protein